MTTIIKDDFKNGSSVSLDMDKDAEELFVFHFNNNGKDCKVYKYDLNSHDMTVAMSRYELCCESEITK